MFRAFCKLSSLYREYKCRRHRFCWHISLWWFFTWYTHILDFIFAERPIYWLQYNNTVHLIDIRVCVWVRIRIYRERYSVPIRIVFSGGPVVVSFPPSYTFSQLFTIINTHTHTEKFPKEQWNCVRMARDVFYGPKIYMAAKRGCVVNYEYIYLCCRMDRKELLRTQTYTQVYVYFSIYIYLNKRLNCYWNK